MNLALRAPFDVDALEQFSESRRCRSADHHGSTISFVRASERQRVSGQLRPAWPGNAMTAQASTDDQCVVDGVERIGTGGGRDHDVLEAEPNRPST